MKIVKICVFLSVLFILNACIPLCAGAQSSKVLTDPSTWAAADDLGRHLSSYSDLQKENTGDRFVGVFFWDWHVDFAKYTRPANLSEIIKKNPEAKNDYQHSAWQGQTGYFFWNEPIYGYYSSDDTYVIRKQAELLADAGVDVIIFDCTNGDFLWEAAYPVIFETFEQAREEGVNTPQIAFMLNFAPEPTTGSMLKRLYQDLYSQKKYQDLWFYWKGKPLIMAYPDALSDTEAVDREIRDFFSFKPMEASYVQSAESSESRWGWLSVYPQGKYGPVTEDGRPEQMTVSVAQNATSSGYLTAMNGEDVRGRTYTSKTGNTSTEEDLLRGTNFQEQWDRVIEADPEFVFVTGWNEWVALRQVDFQGVRNGFADEFNDEFSRDIEPSRGMLKDYYYLQLCENIRRYKGVTKTQLPEKSQYWASIDIGGDISQWDSLAAYYHYTNSTYQRRRSGYLGTRYKNDAVRNDVVTAKVAYDDTNIYFYVETAETLTSYSDNAWMRLFLDTDFTDAGSNWEGFEYVINRVNPTEDKCILEKAAVSDGSEAYKGWVWETIGEVDYTVRDNILQIAVPRAMLGMADSAPVFHFKWSDDMQTDGDIMDFYQYGEAAPGSRFTFVFDPTGVYSAEQGSGLAVWIICGAAVLLVAALVLILCRIKRKSKLSGS